MSPAALSYYERGHREAMFDIRVLLQFADAVAMPRPALLALVLADPSAGDGAWAPGPGPVPGAGLPGEARLRYWQACTTALHRARQAGRGYGHAASGTTAVRQAGQPQAGKGSFATRAVAAGLALFAGEAALDAGDLVLARSLHDAACDLAADLDDTALLVQVMLAQSMLRATVAEADGSREPARQALLLAREAAEEARYERVPQLHALIAIRHARAAALLGDKPVFNAAIARARRELDHARLVGAAPVPVWLQHFGMAEVAAAEAAGTVGLARPDGRLPCTVRHLTRLAARATVPRSPLGWRTRSPHMANTVRRWTSRWMLRCRRWKEALPPPAALTSCAKSRQRPGPSRER